MKTVTHTLHSYFFVPIRRIVYNTLRFFGVSLFGRRFHFEPVILCYHSISDDGWRFSVTLEHFKKQVEFLLETRQAISAHDVLEYTAGRTHFSKPTFLICFDDGYKDILSTKDFLQSKGIKPIVFLLSDPEKVDRKELDTLRPLLNHSDVRECIDAGWTLGSHGATHPDFSSLSIDTIRREVVESKKILETTYGQSISYFAYPKGKYTSHIMRAVQSAGYTLGFSMDQGFVNTRSNQFALPRIGVDGSHSFGEFKSLLSPTVVSFKSHCKKILSYIRAVTMRCLKPLSHYYRFPVRSLSPLSTKFGFDRGTPVDRFYIESFLREHKKRITGVCLEIHDSHYTDIFGSTIAKKDVLDIDSQNRQATIYGDLKALPQVASETYDCIILTHTLGLIDEYEKAIQECFRILKKGGSVIVTVPAMGVAQDPKLAFWRFTARSSEYVFKKYFTHVEVSSFGNVLSGQAFWVGAAAEELTDDELRHNDPRYQIVVGIVAQK